jgi:hypothetical protein
VVMITVVIMIMAVMRVMVTMMNVVVVAISVEVNEKTRKRAGWHRKGDADHGCQGEQSSAIAQMGAAQRRFALFNRASMVSVRCRRLPTVSLLGRKAGGQQPLRLSRSTFIIEGNGQGITFVNELEPSRFRRWCHSVRWPNPSRRSTHNDPGRGYNDNRDGGGDHDRGNGGACRYDSDSGRSRDDDGRDPDSGHSRNIDTVDEPTRARRVPQLLTQRTPVVRNVSNSS